MASPGEIEKLERRWLENMQGLTFAPLAEAYRKAGRLDEAFQTLELGLANHPDYVPAHIVRGRCALAAGDDTVAASAFALVLSFDSLNLIALRGLAEISLRSGRPQEAVLHLRRLLEVDPTDGEATARLAELQAKAPPAPAAEYAPPVPDVGPASAPVPAPGEMVFPLVDLGESDVAPEAPDDRFSLGRSDNDADPLDLHIDEEWSSPGARNEFALANDSETLSAPAGEVGAPDGETDLEADGVSLPSIEIDVVPTLKDLTEAEADTTERSAESAWAFPTESVIPDSEDDAEVPGVRVDLVAESESREVPAPDADDLHEVTLRLLDAEDDLSANPWTPAELPPATGESDFPAEDGEPLAGRIPDDSDPLSGIVDAAPALPDPTDTGFPEPREEGEPETWPEGPPAVSETSLPSDTEVAAGERDPEARAGVPESEPAPFPGTSGGWMSDDTEGDEAPDWSREETLHEVSEDRSFAAAEPLEESHDRTVEGNAEGRETPEPAVMEMSADEPEERGDEASNDDQDDEDALVVTESMAEIFLRQGHDELALAVYTELARRDPENDRLQEAIGRLTPAPAAEDDAPAVESAPARFAASSTGGESLGDFLAGVLAVREPISPLAITPPAMDRPKEGEPTRPADKHFGLDSVFGDDPSDASAPAAATEEGEGTSPSFDEFFSDRPPVVAPPSGTSSASDSEDLQHFNDWLKGLKR